MSHEPDLNRLAALVEGRLEAAERQRVLSHVAECRECREIVSLAAGRPAVGTAAALWKRPAVWLPVAATLAVASVGVLLVTAPGRAPLEPTMTPPATSGADRALPPAGTAPSPPPAIGQPSASPTAPAQPDDLLRRRGGTRQVGAKTFQLVAGEWIDSSYDPGALLPVVDVTSEVARRELLARMPALAPYLALGDRVTVVHEGTVYRFAIAAR